MFSFHDASLALGCSCQMPHPSILIQGAAIDTRKLEPGNLFVALTTDRDDGHRYLETAFLRGASGALIRESYFREHESFLRSKPRVFQNLLTVVEPAVAFGQLARWYRNSNSLQAFGITGSVGKTTTKEFLAFLIKKIAPTLSTEGNLNNHLGLPLTLFGLQPAHRYVVAEMGANQAGDIAHLSDILCPDVGIITQIAPVHLQGFGSLKKIYDAKCELMRVLKPNSPMILPEHDNLLIARAQKLGLKVKTVGFSMRADYQVSHVVTGSGWVSFKINQKWEFRFPGHAAFLAKNAGMAIAAAESAGFLMREMPKVWEGIQFPKGRFQEREYANSVRVIDDGYNANPVSFRKSVETFSALPAVRRRVLVLSDMLELGTDEKKYHEQLGAFLATQPLDLVIAFGPLSKHTAIVCQSAAKDTMRVQYFEQLNEAAEYLLTVLQPDDQVLLKASRGMSMDDVLQIIENKFGQPITRT